MKIRLMKIAHLLIIIFFLFSIGCKKHRSKAHIKPGPPSPPLSTLYIANLGANTIVQYTQSQRMFGGNIAPQVITSGGASFQEPWGVAFDGSGNLWVTNQNTNTILEFESPVTANSGATTILALPNSASPAGMTFDAHGTLWVANSGNATIYGYQTPISSNSIPIVISSASLFSPTDIKFDSLGNLWVANGNNILEFAAADLMSSGAPTPITTVTKTGVGTTNYNGGLAIDGMDNVWAKNQDGNNIDEYTSTQLIPGGTLTLTPNISIDEGGISPEYIAFDSSNNLWITTTQFHTPPTPSPSVIYEYLNTDLICLVPPCTNIPPPTPAVTIVVSPDNDEQLNGLAFDLSGNLWTAFTKANEVLEYLSPLFSGPPPAMTLSPTPFLDFPFGLVFDANGNLWVSNLFAGTLVMYDASQLLTTGTPMPLVTISNSALTDPGALAFDFAGNLWVANVGIQGVANGSTIVEYTAEQLSACALMPFTCTIPPHVIISDPLNPLSPVGLAFDFFGNLWVANGTSIVQFTQRQLAMGGPQTPNQSIPDAFGPGGLVFDVFGNLWVSNLGQFDGTTIFEYTAQQLLMGGAILPNITISGLIAPAGLAFDYFGNLWVSNAGNGSIVALTPQQLLNGTPTPNIIIEGSNTTLQMPLFIAMSPLL